MLLSINNDRPHNEIIHFFDCVCTNAAAFPASLPSPLMITRVHALTYILRSSFLFSWPLWGFSARRIPDGALVHWRQSKLKKIAGEKTRDATAESGGRLFNRWDLGAAGSAAYLARGSWWMAFGSSLLLTAYYFNLFRLCLCYPRQRAKNLIKLAFNWKLVPLESYLFFSIPGALFRRFKTLISA